MTDAQAARQIYQTLLDRFTAGLLSADTGLLLQMVCLPFRMRAPGGAVEYKDLDSYCMAANLYQGMYRSDGITRMERRCDTARMVSPDHIVGHHTTRGWRDDGTEMNAFPSRLHLYRIEGAWKVAAMETAAHSSTWDSMVASGQGNAPDLAALAPISFPEPDLNVLQGVIDWVGTAFTALDVEGWIAGVSLPLTLVRGHRRVVFETTQELRQDFEQFTALFGAYRVTDILGHARSAQRIDDRTIEGRVTSYILRGATPIVAPWDATIVLRRDGDSWKIREIGNALTLTLSTNADVPAQAAAAAPEDACETANRLLDLTWKALKERDFERFQTAFHLPHHVTINDERMVYRTPHDLRGLFDKICVVQDTLRMTDPAAFIDAAEFQTPDRIAATHVTQFLRDGRAAPDSVRVLSIIERISGSWKVVSSDYSAEAATITRPAPSDISPPGADAGRAPDPAIAAPTNRHATQRNRK